MVQVNFFSLPRELRDAIYSLGFEPGHYLCKDDPWLFGLRIGSEHLGPFHDLPVWLYASRQVMGEGLQQFYREATCVSILDRDLDEGGPRAELLLDPQKIERVLACLEVNVRTPVTRTSTGDEVAIQLVNNLLGRSPREQKYFAHNVSLNAKYLTVEFFFHDNPDLFLYSVKQRAPHFTFPFDVLEVYGQEFERIRFSVRQPYLDMYQRDCRPSHERLLNLEICYIAFQKEIQRWAVEHISGPEKHACVVRDWVEHSNNAPIQWTWCFEACRTDRQSGDSVHHIGMVAFQYACDHPSRFEDRREGENGRVEWSSEKGERESIVRPQWLIDFADKGKHMEGAGGSRKRKFSG